MLVTLDLLSLNKGLGFLLDDLDMTEIIFACDLRYYGTGDFLLTPGSGYKKDRERKGPCVEPLASRWGRKLHMSLTFDL